jgi:hypothetical protein
MEVTNVSEEYIASNFWVEVTTFTLLQTAKILGSKHQDGEAYVLKPMPIPL